MKSKFKIGDTVAWDGSVASEHAEGSILRKSRLKPGTPVGTIISYANEQKTYVVVQFDAEYLEHAVVVQASETHEDDDCLTLTIEELTKVFDDALEAE